MGKEKMIQIYEKVADMTLEILDTAIKNKAGYLDEDDLNMVRTTLNLYDAVSRANQPMITSASVLDFTSN